MPSPDKCRSCQADVIFVPSAKSGKPMILDAKPEARVVLVNAETELLMRSPSPDAMNLAKARVAQTFIDHHVTCPAAEKWKGRTR